MGFIHYLHFDMPLGMKADAMVMTVQDLYPLTLPGYCSATRKAYFKHLTRHNTRRAAAVISVSENTKKDLVNCLRVPEEKIHVIPHGIARDFRLMDDAERLATVRQRHQLPDRFILYTGMHKTHKNLSRLLKAYARLPETQQAEYSLVLTGPVNDDTDILKEETQTLNISPQVMFLGLIPFADLPVLYNLA